MIVISKTKITRIRITFTKCFTKYTRLSLLDGSTAFQSLDIGERYIEIFYIQLRQNIKILSFMLIDIVMAYFWIDLRI